jgi:RimJ/RimL family protein N-acetyltransferase
VELTLRAPTEADIPILFAFQADPVAGEMAAFASRDREAFEAHHRRIVADPSVRLSVVQVVGRVVGSIVSWQAGGEREVGYWYGRAHWGKGFATAGLRRFLDEVDATRPLFASVAAHSVCVATCAARHRFHRGATEAGRRCRRSGLPTRRRD